MSKEDWLLIEALVLLCLPLFFTGIGIAFVIVSLFHGGEDV